MFQKGAEEFWPQRFWGYRASRGPCWGCASDPTQSQKPYLGSQKKLRLSDKHGTQGNESF